MPRKVFIAYDFDIKGTLPGNLEAVKLKPPEEFEVEWPGSPGAKGQGAIWNDIVQPRIGWCDRLLAFVDLPNANVSFELGYALGSAKQVAFAHVRPDLPTWLKNPPLNGFICEKAGTLSEIRDLVAQERWVSQAGRPVRGDGVLLLCPHRTGEAYLEQIDPGWGWRQTKKHGWDLYAIHDLFSEIGRVVWIIAPHDEGPAGRDGEENAALAILAGYAHAQGLPIDIFQQTDTDTRVVVDVVSQQQPFSTLDQLVSLLKAIADEQKRIVAEKTGAARPIGDGRPTCLPPLPEDDWLLYAPRFIGRELQLSDAAAAVRGAVAQASGAAFAAGEAVRVLWVHGFGGMGKSWFLYRAAEQARQTAPTIDIIRVDWDAPVWRQPLDGEPLSVPDLFMPIAWRLAQVRGIESAEAYWRARARVEAAADDHRGLHLSFENALTRAEQSEQIDTALLDLLQNEGLWDDDLERRRRKLLAWRRDAARRSRTFEAWCRKAAPGRLADSDAGVVPERVLAEGLGEALRVSAAARGPLLLLLDTCEILSPELDRWVRRLVANLVQMRAPVLTLIGSRLPPDVAQPDGGREGWQAEIPRAAFRVVPFDEHVRFTVKEIEEALAKLPRPAPDIDGLAERLHAITRGVPLALRALLDLYEKEAEPSILGALGENEELDESLEEGEAVRRIVRTVAHRMLHHLENRPERLDDLEAIVALALLPRADQTVLAVLWPGGPVRSRLRDLAVRYSLIGGGDLHPIVREYLRRHWRADEEDRPAVFEHVLTNLVQASADLPPLTASDGNSEVLWRRLLDVTLATWQIGDAALGELARALTVALAYEKYASDFLALLRELPLRSAVACKVRAELPKEGEWERWEFKWWGKGKLIRGLRIAAERAREWSVKETACLDLLECLASPWPDSIEQGERTCRALLGALKHFERADLPQDAAVAETLGRAADLLADNVRTGADEALGRLAEEACKQTLELEPNAAGRHHSLGYLYDVRLRRPQDAEGCYLKAIELDPKFAYPHNNLGSLYQDNLQRPQDAEGCYLKAIELDPKDALPHNGLGSLYQDKLQRPQDAEGCYLKAIELDPKFASPHYNLGRLYKEKLQRPQDAEGCYLKAIELDPKDALPHHGLGGLYQYKLQRPQDAEGCYLKAIELDPKFASPHSGLGLLYQDKLQRPQDAEGYYLKAIELDPKFASPHYSLGRLYTEKLQRPQDAEGCYLKAIELDPKDALPHNGLGSLYLDKLQRPQDAEGCYLKAIELDPKFASPHYGLGRLYQDKLQRSQDAEGCYLKAIELDPKDALPHYGLGGLYQDKLQRPQDAEGCYLKAIELDPKFASPHYGLGRLYKEKLQRPQDAEGCYLKAIELDPKFASPHYGLGGLYQYKLQRPQDAEGCYLKAIELDPKFASPHSGLGDLYRDALNRPQDAERCYKRIIELDPTQGTPYADLALLYLQRSESAKVCECARRAIELMPNDPVCLFAENNVKLWTEGWESARAGVIRWLEAAQDDLLASHYRRWLIAFTWKVREYGGLKELARHLAATRDRPWWRAWSEAVACLASDGRVDRWQDPAAEQLYRDLDTGSSARERGQSPTKSG